MINYKSPNQQCVRGPSYLKRKQEHGPSPELSEPALKKAQYMKQSKAFRDDPIPSIEEESGPAYDSMSEDKAPCYQQYPPQFIPKGVLVGFWCTDLKGTGRRPVYCLVKRNFEFAYHKDGWHLVRDYDFDPLDNCGYWRGDDREDEDALSPEKIKEWVRKKWKAHIKKGRSRPLSC